MLPVHDISLFAEIRAPLANHLATGADRCAECMSGRVPWSATTPRRSLPQGLSRREDGFKAVSGASAQV